jgi:hypothetical protein
MMTLVSSCFQNWGSAPLESSTSHSIPLLSLWQTPSLRTWQLPTPAVTSPTSSHSRWACPLRECATGLFLPFFVTSVTSHASLHSQAPSVTEWVHWPLGLLDMTSQRPLRQHAHSALDAVSGRFKVLGLTAMVPGSRAGHLWWPLACCMRSSRLGLRWSLESLPFQPHKTYASLLYLKYPQSQLVNKTCV